MQRLAITIKKKILINIVCKIRHIEKAYIIAFTYSLCCTVMQANNRQCSDAKALTTLRTRRKKETQAVYTCYCETQAAGIRKTSRVSTHEAPAKPRLPFSSLPAT